ncbi:hypothetical protein [Pseudomonas sp. lyk4-R2A-8]|jgi:hypothetical protein|uniref:hypothetical protein n=1 Tax=Pseudomonas sp. lyk4-R2A-8 TaxID=3040316 RepID=UPI002556E6F3|nr:hypothetical protein [Pseudomonas sp. lyk4-R2A-8]
MLIDPAYVLFETDPAGDSRTVRRAGHRLPARLYAPLIPIFALTGIAVMQAICICGYTSIWQFSHLWIQFKKDIWIWPA